jgi:hypothetical protein
VVKHYEQRREAADAVQADEALAGDHRHLHCRRLVHGHHCDSLSFIT